MMEMNINTQLINSVLYGAVAGLATIGGIYILLANEKWALRNSILFISFAAGVMLTVAFTNLLPEAIEATDKALPVVLVTLIAFYVVEHIIMIHSCAEEECSTHPMGWMGFIGIGFHSLLDGMAIGVGFEAGFKVGLATAIGVLLHEVPEGINMTALLIHSGYEKRRTVMLSWLVALAIPLGAVISHLLFKGVSENILGILLAIAAGSFIYISAADLIPETHRNSRKTNIVLVITGGLLVYIVGNVIGRH